MARRVVKISQSISVSPESTAEVSSEVCCLVCGSVALRVMSCFVALEGQCSRLLCRSKEDQAPSSQLFFCSQVVSIMSFGHGTKNEYYGHRMRTNSRWR